MDNAPKLTLPESPAQRKSSSLGLLKFLSGLILVSQTAVIALLWLYPPSNTLSLPAAPQYEQLLKKTAMELEELGLALRAAQLWEQYTEQQDDKAPLYFRIGRLYQEAGEYQNAVDFYHRAEYSGADEQMRQDTAERITQCLERLRRFHAVAEVLRKRTDIVRAGEQEQKENRVIAKIGNREITTGQLDTIIQQQIQLSGPLAAQLEQRYKTAEGRKQALQDYFSQEVLWREALADELDKSKQHLRQMAQLQRRMLAQEVLQRRLTSQAVVLDEEISSYYQMRQEQFKQPAQAQIWVAMFTTEKQAQAKAAEITTADQFEQLPDKTAVEVNATSEELPGFGKVTGLVEKIFASDAAGLLPGVFSCEKGFLLAWIREKTPEQIQPLAEVRSAIEPILEQQKSQRVLQQFLQELFAKYQVEIYEKDNEQ